MASMPWRRSTRITVATPSFIFKGFVREVPRIVPPSGRMPRTSAGRSSSMTPLSRQPAQPFWTPLTEWPSWNARRATARIAAFSPGASPPPVRTPMRTGDRLRPVDSSQELLEGDVGQGRQRHVGVREVEPRGDRVGNGDAAHARTLGRSDSVRGVFDGDRLACADAKALEDRDVEVRLGLGMRGVVPAPQALEAVEDAEAREVSPHPVARGARGDAKLQAELPRRVQVLE